jgi:two-component system, OmpR family, sensor histidine kinase VicK
LGNTFIERDVRETSEIEDAAYRLAAIVASSDDAIVSKDLDGTVMSWNASAERIFGYSADEIIGRSIRLIIPADRQGEEDEVLARVRSGDRVEHFDTVRQRKDGSLVDISLTVSPIRDRTGRIIGASKIARDISERKQTEELLKQTIALKDQFLGMVSHELRTPIATVLGNGQLLLRRGDMLQESDKKQALVDIVSETERLQRIIENLLVLSRMDAGRELHPEPLHMPRVVAEAVESFQRHSFGREVRVALEGEVPIANAEPLLVNHVLENLLSNATKYSPAGTPIDVVVTTNERHEPLVRVLDQGMGFSAEDQAELFTPFYRSKAAAAKAGGMGLGLAVCRRILEVQGGTIEAKSRPEGGAEFSFTLPAA